MILSMYIYVCDACVFLSVKLVFVICLFSIKSLFQSYNNFTNNDNYKDIKIPGLRSFADLVPISPLHTLMSYA